MIVFCIHIFFLLIFQDAVKYVNTPINAPETYSIPRADKPVPKYLEIIYDENDDRPLPLNPYEIPLPQLVDGEHVEGSSLAASENSNSTNSIKMSANNADAHNENSVKSRTISSSSTVSETSVYSQPKKKEQLNAQPEDNDLTKTNLKVALPNSNEDCTSNELMSQQSAHTNNISKRKLQQLYANTNVETAIRSCDGITSM